MCLGNRALCGERYQFRANLSRPNKQATDAWNIQIENNLMQGESTSASTVNVAGSLSTGGGNWDLNTIQMVLPDFGSLLDPSAMVDKEECTNANIDANSWDWVLEKCMDGLLSNNQSRLH